MLVPSGGAAERSAIAMVGIGASDGWRQQKQLHLGAESVLLPIKLRGWSCRADFHRAKRAGQFSGVLSVFCATAAGRVTYSEAVCNRRKKTDDLSFHLVGLDSKGQPSVEKNNWHITGLCEL